MQSRECTMHTAQLLSNWRNIGFAASLGEPLIPATQKGSTSTVHLRQLS